MITMARAWVAAAVIGVGAFSSLSAATVSSTSIDDEMLAMQNEFQLGNGQSKIIADHKHPEAYRLCVKQGAGVVPLQVTADGKVQNVNAGSCANFNAAMIKIAPAAKLGADQVLVGKYKRAAKS
jgi:hypothetical protein